MGWYRCDFDRGRGGARAERRARCTSRRRLALALALSWLLAGCALIDTIGGGSDDDAGDDGDDGASDLGDGGDPGDGGDFPDAGGPDADVPSLFPGRDEVDVQGALGIAICDVTGDGQGDVIVSDDGRRISRLEDGERVDLIAGLEMSFRRIVCAELNQNDTPDVIGINDDFEPPQLVLFLDVAGALQTLTVAIGPFTILYSVTVGDLNRDGLVDLATTGIDQVVLFQDPGGGGLFTSAPSPLPDDDTIDRISIVDQDEVDGNDLVFAQSGRFALMKQTSTPGEFFPEQTLFEPSEEAIQDALVADLDGQGRPEIIGSVSDGPIILSPTSGDEFDVITTGAPDNYVSGRLAVGDVTGDGLPEIVMTGYEVAIFRQEGPLEFDPVPETISTSSTQAAMGDVDGDGRADMALLSGSTVSLLLTRASESP